MDASTLEYLAQTGREKHSLKVTKEYLQKVGLFRINPEDNDHEDDVVYDEIIEIYLPDIVVTISGKIFFPFWPVFGNLNKSKETTPTTTTLEDHYSQKLKSPLLDLTS